MKKIMIALLAIVVLNTTPVFAQQPQTLEQIVTAARNGDLPSINMMGNLHKVGNSNFGMPVNIAEAKAWFEIGASKGYAPSIFNLGFFYENGAQGIPKDIEKARAYYAQASKLGFTRAQERLAALPPKAVATNASPARIQALVVKCLKEMARDPESLVTRNIGLAYGMTDYWQGEFNGRNGYGGMSGWTQFTFFWLNGQMLVISIDQKQYFC
jgi:hypothetical protein